MKRITNTIRMLAIDTIANAKTGHSGMALSAAPLLTALYHDHLLTSPLDTNFFGRDRFVLSAGHGSALLYSLLHLFGFDISIQDLKEFKSGNEKTAGHPELNVKIGVEMSTGPLGQGIASAVGMALAEAFLAKTFNKKGMKVIDHYTYVLAGDGCMMEGIEAEAASFAGTQKLGKLIVLYDANGATLDSLNSVAFTEDVAKRHAAQGWNVFLVNGKNTLEISKAIALAKHQKERPTLIVCKTKIGEGSPLAGDFKSHGKVFSLEEVATIRKYFKLKNKPFEVGNRVLKKMVKLKEKKGKAFAKKTAVWEKYEKKYPEEFKKLQNWITGEPLQNLTDSDFEIKSTIAAGGETALSESGRETASKVLNTLSKKLPNLLVGTADLSSSTLCRIEGGGVFSSKNRTGRNIFFGVREHAMAAIANGIALHGGLEVVCSTFFVFSDYLKNAMRMSALMNLKVLFHFTHDSIAIGADGPTHQPVEQLAGMRATPNLKVIRPYGAIEVQAAMKMHFMGQGPTALVLSRQNLEAAGSFAGVEKGGYVISPETKNKTLDLTLISAGSEVETCLKVKESLKKKLNIRVVSVPATSVFDSQTEAHKLAVLGKGKKFAVEASSDPIWWKYVKGDGKVHLIHEFGISAPPEKVQEKFEMDPASVEKLILEQNKPKTVKKIKKD